MKYLFYFISFLCLVSCEITGFNTTCDEKLELTEKELSWGKERDSILYSSSKGYYVNTYLDQVLNADLGNECPEPANKQIYYNVINSNRISTISYFLSKTKQYGSHISFQFNTQNSNNQIPIVSISQSMGNIDIETNQPRDIREVDYAQTTKLGTHELNGKTYSDVFVIEDLKESEVPQIDIFRFYVNPSGILRIEFYDGEIWDRVD